jgi:hypothetical protein
VRESTERASAPVDLHGAARSQLAGLREALWALWDLCSRVLKGNELACVVCKRAGAGPGFAAPGANLAGFEVVDMHAPFPRLAHKTRAPAFPHSPPMSPLIPQFPDSAFGCPSPHTRGCLFLLGLSMLSLFKRLCHRLDAGNKVRRCV